MTQPSDDFARDWPELGRPVVFPWHCDHIGHMNVRWYGNFFDDAAFQLWTVVGVPQSAMRGNGPIVVMAQTSIDYVRELTAGSLTVIRGAFTHVGNRSVRHHMRMYNADTGALAATQNSAQVFFDPQTRKSAAMPDEIRRRLLERVQKLPEEARRR